ncbi:hypothetical protein A2U01_0074291, partial [Trifolium medium]|nr:hypothetical protein [Trifolium medium]
SFSYGCKNHGVTIALWDLASWHYATLKHKKKPYVPSQLGRDIMRSTIAEHSAG